MEAVAESRSARRLRGDADGRGAINERPSFGREGGRSGGRRGGGVPPELEEVVSRVGQAPFGPDGGPAAA
jgi:hypothetical protein